MSDEEIREDDGEEMIEVVTEDSGEAKSESTEAGKGVDIIGDKPVRKGSNQQTPGCLYSFLLFVIGAFAGVAVFWSLSYTELNKGEEYTGLETTLGASRNKVNGMVKTEYEKAYEAASQRNFGLACDALAVADNYLDIAEGMTVVGKRSGDSAMIADIIKGFKSDDPQERETAFGKLADKLGKPKEATKAPGTESSAQAATEEKKAEPAKAAETPAAKNEGAAGKAAEPSAAKEAASPPPP